MRIEKIFDSMQCLKSQKVPLAVFLFEIKLKRWINSCNCRGDPRHVNVMTPYHAAPQHYPSGFEQIDHVENGKIPLEDDVMQLGTQLKYQSIAFKKIEDHIGLKSGCNIVIHHEAAFTTLARLIEIDLVAHISRHDESFRYDVSRRRTRDEESWIETVLVRQEDQECEAGQNSSALMPHGSLNLQHEVVL
ncbi:hypothetical protein IEQ34_013033 [Dendrobium chrysotoxum]|uniref:Uncharacterized protein n=1 Tax=Dendrobium chrysotoxum TaxID=161865 RepID=A0AAV7GPV3_DENCH|nr:hypothetical protein IEQ34_013033 [Dendrobium chrysotoxum]